MKLSKCFPLPTVVDVRISKYDVLICRPTKWGNPFSHLPHSKALYKVDSVQEAIDKYEEYIRAQPELLKALPSLKGKTLGCWCAPGPCHGDVLIKLIKEFGL